MVPKKRLIVVISMITFSVQSQVGIGTVSPSETLDVDGKIRVRQVDATADAALAKDNILTVSATGVVEKVTANQIIQNSLNSVVFGILPAGLASTQLNLVSKKGIIKFGAPIIDLNTEFDVANSRFVAKTNGTYMIQAKVRMSGSSPGNGQEIGLAVVKNGTIVTLESYTNPNFSIAALGVGLTYIPIVVRNIFCVVQLIQGDVITFEMTSSLATVANYSLIDGFETFFSIYQIR